MIPATRGQDLGQPGLALSPGLLERCLRSDSEAWEELICLTSSGVRSLALRLARNREDAQDLCQQVFVRLVEPGNDGRMRLAQYEPSRLPFDRFLVVLTYRCFYDLVRRRRSRVDQGSEDGESLIASLPSKESADTLLLAREYQEVLDQLPPREKLAFSLFHCGWAYKEIAQAMCISVGGTSAIIHQARQHLAAKLVARGLVEPASIALRSQEIGRLGEGVDS
jgi:RNA polymerase sigma-70 factor (ECF subfamily)